MACRDYTESPVFENSSLRKRDPKNEVNLEEMYKRLVSHAKGEVVIPKNNLKLIVTQINKIDPGTPRNRCLLVKAKSLLNLIFKKRSDFQTSTFNGEITIYEKPSSQQNSHSIQFCDSPRSQSQPSSNYPSNFFTNENFVTMPSIKMDVESSENYSADLFPSDSVDSLRAFSQQNYQMLKNLTSDSPDNKIFKMPQPKQEQIENVYKTHDALDENFDSLITQKYDTEETICNTEKANNTLENPFNNLTISKDELKAEFAKMHDQTQNWFFGILKDFANFKVDEKKQAVNPTSDEQNIVKVDSSCNSVAEAPHLLKINEENLKTIRFVRSAIRETLEKEMKANPDLGFLRDVLGSAEHLG